MRTILTLSILLLVCHGASAQRTIYQCNGVYTDQPCANGREVDVAPTRGANSYSGRRMESHEAVMENVMRDMQSAQRQGFQTAAQIIRCEDLRSRRAAIDAAGQAVARKEERFQIRQDQFKLNCKNN